MNVDLPVEAVAGALAREMLAIFERGDDLPAPLADLIREGCAQGIERRIKDRELFTADELAAKMGWSTRKFHSWAKTVGLPQPRKGADVYRFADVLDRHDFGPGLVSPARTALQREIDGLRAELALVKSAEARRAAAEHPPRLLERAG